MSVQEKPKGTLIKKWPSSKGDKEYELWIGVDDKPYCTCPAWKFSKKDPRECKHMLEFAHSVAKRAGSIGGKQ